MIFDFIFPNRCLACNTIIAKREIICEVCEDLVSFTGHRFGDENDLTAKAKLLFPVGNAFSLMMFSKGSLSQKIIHQLKYNNREKIGGKLAEWVAKRLNFDGNKPDLILTVPLHPKKLKQRGYNQLHIFGNKISENYQIPISHTILKRAKHTKAQARKNQKNRLKTENVFELTEPLRNLHILLIDDVFTTGNTISNVAWEIFRKSENVKISLLVMAMD